MDALESKDGILLHGVRDFLQGFELLRRHAVLVISPLDHFLDQFQNGHLPKSRSDSQLVPMGYSVDDNRVWGSPEEPRRHAVVAPKHHIGTIEACADKRFGEGVILARGTGIRQCFAR